MCALPLNQIPFFISCLESRVETATSFYGCFSLGFFEKSDCLTIANALRRTLLTQIYGLAITSVKIEGVNHEYQGIAGVKESVLDIVLNLKEIVLKHVHMDTKLLSGVNRTYILKKPLFGYIQVRGPGIIRAKDLKLPSVLQCVNPTQYITTLSEDGVLNMKLKIGSFFTEKFTIQGTNNESYKEKRDWQFQDFKNVKLPIDNGSYGFHNVLDHVGQYSSKEKPIDLEVFFPPVCKVNYMLTQATPKKTSVASILVNDPFTAVNDHKIILEVWTNGSIHPSQAVSEALKSLTYKFYKLQKFQNA
uniref:Plastid-encoded RNA polymerase subunit alpha n=1 Tax=Jenufa minuta TaxID=993092 RepID=A0A0S2LNI0_JENMI|nr:alpha subunit of RNA polymerase [Jenufa minuta]ALO62978.1 alpha subunit of RNA polymerase [Jenufa minuta]